VGGVRLVLYGMTLRIILAGGGVKMGWDVECEDSVTRHGTWHVMTHVLCMWRMQQCCMQLILTEYIVL
jgi:hypothetical protein